MSYSTLPLGYCTNVHPGRTVAEVLHGLATYTVPVQRKVVRPIAAGLWLAASVIRELESDPAALPLLRDLLEAQGLVCYTLNTFPYGDFHGTRVKEQVYLPDWTSPQRQEYTLACAKVLAELMPEGVEGSLSTVPLGFKDLSQREGFEAACIDRLIQAAAALDNLHDETGRVLRLAIEPEPLCVLETTVETIAFFQKLREEAAKQRLEDAVARHIGVCYDVCHQSIEFEDVAESIARLNHSRIRINKVHITCAVRLEQPGTNAAGREALRHFVEERYLHQTFAKTDSGEVIHQTDLDASLCASPPPAFANSPEWRVHFHVPVDAESIGPLRTTQDDLVRALAAVRQLEYAPHLEVETYTWGVLPGSVKPSLVDGITKELLATQALLG